MVNLARAIPGKLRKFFRWYIRHNLGNALRNPPLGLRGRNGFRLLQYAINDPLYQLLHRDALRKRLGLQGGFLVIGEFKNQCHGLHFTEKLETGRSPFLCQ